MNGKFFNQGNMGDNNQYGMNNSPQNMNNQFGNYNQPNPGMPPMGNNQGMMNQDMMNQGMMPQNSGMPQQNSSTGSTKKFFDFGNSNTEEQPQPNTNNMDNNLSPSNNYGNGGANLGVFNQFTENYSEGMGNPNDMKQQNMNNYHSVQTNNVSNYNSNDGLNQNYGGYGMTQQNNMPQQNMNQYNQGMMPPQNNMNQYNQGMMPPQNDMNQYSQNTMGYGMNPNMSNQFNINQQNDMNQYNQNTMGYGMNPNMSNQFNMNQQNNINPSMNSFNQNMNDFSMKKKGLNLPINFKNIMNDKKKIGLILGAVVGLILIIALALSMGGTKTLTCSSDVSLGEFSRKDTFEIKVKKNTVKSTKYTLVVNYDSEEMAKEQVNLLEQSTKEVLDDANIKAYDIKRKGSQVTFRATLDNGFYNTKSTNYKSLKEYFEKLEYTCK